MPEAVPVAQSAAPPPTPPRKRGGEGDFPSLRSGEGLGVGP